MVRRFAGAYIGIRYLLPVIVALFVVGAFVMLVLLASGPQ